MIRCKPLLGTFVEILAEDGINTSPAIDKAFLAIEQVQFLMGFHDPDSELSKINALAHLQPIQIHPWTTQVLTTAKEIHRQSGGLFNCGIGHHLVKTALLPKHLYFDQYSFSGFGGLENLHFLDGNTVHSDLPLCLDLGGIAKGFAVDMAVQAMQSAGVPSGSVNAGGDLRIFGKEVHPILVRHPTNPHELIHIGDICEGAIATSALYYNKREKYSKSYMVNPISQEHIAFSESYSVIAQECIYADALTKVVSLSGDITHPCLQPFAAQAIRIPNQ